MNEADRSRRKPEGSCLATARWHESNKIEREQRTEIFLYEAVSDQGQCAWLLIRSN